MVVQLYAVENLVNKATSAINNPNGFYSLIIAAIILSFVLIASKILSGFMNYNLNYLILSTKGIMTAKLNEKMSDVPLEFHYKSEFEDQKNMAKSGASGAVLTLLITIMLLSFNIPYFIFFSVYLLRSSPLLLLIIPFLFLPNIIAKIKSKNSFLNREQEVAPIRRRLDYFLEAIGSNKYLKETRVLDVVPLFNSMYLKDNDSYYKKSLVAEKFLTINTLQVQSIKIVGYVLTVILLIFSVVTQRISIGVFSAVISSITDMISIIDDTLERDLGNIVRNGAAMKSYVDFLNLDFSPVTTELSFEKSIRFENVSYSYPATDHPAVDNLNFIINKGETIVLVGENGAGKTTVSKLILGLLTPSSGKIYLDDRELDIKTSRIGKTTATFQDYERYQLTLKDNVRISDSELSKNTCDYLTENGVMYKDLKTYPLGIETRLSKEFDGVDISGGQWQRIALSRGQYRDHSLIVLDEPMSAIDPLEEHKLYTHFRNISKGKTAIIVTHRLGLTSIADRIFVFDNGHLSESGTHVELMERNDQYAKMYRSQAGGYTDHLL
jgi:ATP-binding cassette subfamily B protein